MGWPQIIYIALLFAGVGLTCARHGEPKTGNHDGWASVIAAAITLALLWAGGFFA